MAKRGPKSPLTDQHKAALAQGRVEGRAVRAYLEALRGNKPKRGRRRTSDSIKKRLNTINDQLKSADPLTEVRLVQERRDLTSELDGMQSNVDLKTIEDDFVKVVANYSKRQGISYASWREVGVPASVLTKAGLSRSA
jgi:uncharacterized protein YicC (UPF0701 family)